MTLLLSYNYQEDLLESMSTKIKQCVAPILIEKRHTGIPKVQINIEKYNKTPPDPTFLQKAIINHPELAVDNDPKIPDLQTKPNFRSILLNNKFKTVC